MRGREEPFGRATIQRNAADLLAVIELQRTDRSERRAVQQHRSLAGVYHSQLDGIEEHTKIGADQARAPASGGGNPDGERRAAAACIEPDTADAIRHCQRQGGEQRQVGRQWAKTHAPKLGAGLNGTATDPAREGAKRRRPLVAGCWLLVEARGSRVEGRGSLSSPRFVRAAGS